uniref:CopG family transcriptional regulator n=1 Tax=Escherichia coli TaxID=562 RepID=A0A3G1QCB2_ECOLX|nr:hypothetical protein [Escherichia coli]
MALKLNRPNIDESQQPATSRNRAFISGATRAPVAGKPKLMNFRLPAYFEEILEAEAQRTGQSKTTVLKAALAAFDNLDENLKNHWLLESAKLG